jgi:hypothetical protein
LLAKNLAQDDIESEFASLLKKATSDSKEGEMEEEVDKRIYHDTELVILGARDLGLEKASVDPFCIIYFNGEEVGRSAIKRRTGSPEWEDELFTVKVPGEGELAACNLVVEVWTMPKLGKGELLGVCTISGKALVTLLSSPRMKTRWYDVVQSMHLSEDGKTPTNFAMVNMSGDRVYGNKDLLPVVGQLRLAGRPMTVETNTDVAKDLGNIEIQVRAVDVTVLRNIMSKGKSANLKFVRLFCTVYWNGRELYRSKPTAAGTWPLIGTDDNFGVVTRLANDRTLFQSKIRIVVWRTADSRDENNKKFPRTGRDNENNHYSLKGDLALAYADVSSTEMQGHLSAGGCRTVWYHFLYFHHNHSALTLCPVAIISYSTHTHTHAHTNIHILTTIVRIGIGFQVPPVRGEARGPRGLKRRHGGQ